jgi:mgtE-like transporter
MTHFRARGVVDKDFKEIFSAQFLAVTTALIAGVLLTTLTKHFELIPALLILIPGFLALQGNVLSSLAARLSVGLHLKRIKPKIKINKTITENVKASLFLVILISLILGVIAYLVTYLIFKATDPAIIFISIIAGVITILIEIPLVILTTFWLYKHKYEPDDIMGPYATTSSDVIAILAILISIIIIL